MNRGILLPETVPHQRRAQVVATKGQRDVDAAAAAGAEIYIVGQLTNEDVTIDSFDVASDHRIGTIHFALDRVE